MEKYKLLILSDETESYRALIESAHINADICSAPARDSVIALCDPSLMVSALNSLPNLKWVQSIWAGIEPLLDPALRRDYILTNARGIFGDLMSEYVMGYLLAHERRIVQLREYQNAKRWDNSNNGTLRGKTIGLLGVGSIGAEVARAAKFFGMTVRGYTRSSESSAHVDRYYHGSDLLPFAKGLDYLVNVLPNTTLTRKIVNADLLNALPPHAMFINVGRGAAVDESALITALNKGRLASTVLDVFEKEPLPINHPFWTTPNLHITFHTAAPSLPEDIVKLFLENYQLFVEGKPLKYQVDFERGY